MLRRVVRVVTVTCLAFLAVGTPAEAQRGGGPPGPPVVLSASPNVPAGTLSIAGTNFGTAPTVVLGGSPLTLISGTNTNIVAVLPSLLPQDYQLTVTNPSTALSVNFSLTIEAGDVTRVIAGIGLSGGATTGDATVAVDTAQIQKRITGSCPAGSAIQSVDAGGNVTCETDDVGGGGGATLGANTFTGTQTIDAGNLDLDPSSATSGKITKNGTLFLHNFGTQNTFLGVTAGNTALTGSTNTAVGYQALRDITSGSGNTAYGNQALSSNTTGPSNTALGGNALASNMTGNGNVAVGGAALASNVSGIQNVAVGGNTLAQSTGNFNVAIGQSAGANLTGGSNNIYLGSLVFGQSNESNTMYLGGTQTKSVIAGVPGTNVTGAEMVVIDANGRLGSAPVGAGTDTVGSAQVVDDSLTASDLAPNSVTTSELASDAVTVDKVAFNYAAGTSEGGAALDVACLACVDASEVSFSFASRAANTFTATQTIDTGNLDLDFSTATTGNITKNGTRFLHNPGTENTFVGLAAGNLTVVGGANTAIGDSALGFVTDGGSNTAVGAGALDQNNTGFDNTAIGVGALPSNTDGRFNTAVGRFALQNNVLGSNNVALGSNAGVLATGFNNIYVGANVLGVAGEFRTMRLGNQDPSAGSTVGKTVIAGIRGIATGISDAIPVMIDSAGQLGTISSSRRFKDDIQDMANASRRLFQLRPVTFRYQQAYGDGSKPIQYGLIAEEVAEVFPELAVRNPSGGFDTVHYETLSVLLLNELQKQNAEMERQRQRIEVLEKQLNEIFGPAQTSR